MSKDYLLIETEKQHDKAEATKKWFWMMDWCKKNEVSPAQKYWWNKAEEAYNNQSK